MVSFHWTIWDPTEEKCFLLSHSIATFKHFWGNDVHYRVFTDSQSTVKRFLRVEAEIIEFGEFAPSKFNIDALTTWKKWVPKCKLETFSTEFHVDIDIFLINYPKELHEFINSQKQYICMVENFYELWPYGNFAKFLPEDFAPINAGFFGQNSGCDISNNLNKSFDWWYQSCYKKNELYHDEQGGLLYSLLDSIKNDLVYFLPKEKYRNVSPFDPPITDFSDVCLIHTTCDNHPGFYDNIELISTISGLPRM